MYIRNIICINCSNKGHTFKDCIYPITSYGIIAFKKFYENNDLIIKYLLVQRKDSIGYIDFIRGKYDNKVKKEQIFKILLGEMTLEEKKRILTHDFDSLWNLLWMNKESRVFLNDYALAKQKFESMDVKSMIRDSLEETKWSYTEYSIPKGRRNNSEGVVDCALREFTEETGYKSQEIKLIQNLKPIEEVFYGSNGIAYRHVYYIAEIITDRLPDIDETNVVQAGEIKKLQWFSYKDAMNIFRNYDTTKRTIIYKINRFLEFNFLSSSLI